MSSLALPQELVNVIIDEVGKQNDIPTLRSCSLTALGFVFPAQHYLFQTIDLDRRAPRVKYFQQFCRLIQSKPHIGTHVRQLRLGDDTDEDHVSWRGGKNASWIGNAKELPQLLHMLPKLRAFSLTFNSEMMPWTSLSPANRMALTALFNLDTLDSVSLEFMTAIPHSIISKLYTLNTLGLSCVEVDASPNIHRAVLPISFSPLTTLHLRGTTPATINSMVRLSENAPAGSSRLRKLSITPTFEAGFSDSVFDLMKYHRNITHFEWLPSIHFNSSAGSIDLNILPSLRTLTLLISFRKTSAGHGPFSEAIRLLTQISSTSQPNNIETVVLDCHCIRSADTKARRVEWRPMDKLLSKSAFANLREVKVQLAASTCSAVERSNFVLAFQNLLPKVEERGTLISLHNYNLADDRFFMTEMGSRV